MSVSLTKHPQGNVYWKTARDLFCSVQFIKGRGYFVATMNNGEERVCFWHSHEAKQAQAWLRKAAGGVA